MLVDGLVNLVSGLGTERDKATGAYYAPYVQNDADLYNAYHASSLIRRAVDLPAEDACREWREWQAEGVEISAIEAEEARLDIRGKVIAAQGLARLYGGAGLIIGTGEADMTKPLDPERVKRGGLRYVAVLSRLDLHPGEIDTAPASEGFGKPRYWQAGGDMTEIHPSRLVIFHGLPPLAGLTQPGAQHGWGASVLPGMMDALIRVDELAANVNSLVYEAKIDVLKVPNFMANLATRGDAYASEIVRRARLAAMAKGINGMLLLDAGEEYEQKTAGFGGLPEILDRAMQIASAKAGIPATVLFGMAPAGMNATGASDIRLYYDRVRALQTLQMQPAMAILDECLVRSALGARPDELHYTWRPLWQPDMEQRAKVADTLMTALTKLHAMGQAPLEAITEAAVNAMTEVGAFPGLEASVASFYEENPPDDDEDGLTEPPAPEPQKPAPKDPEPVKDAAPVESLADQLAKVAAAMPVPQVTVAAPQVTVAAPDIKLGDVAVTVEGAKPGKKIKTVTGYDDKGRITGMTEEDAPE